MNNNCPQLLKKITEKTILAGQLHFEQEWLASELNITLERISSYLAVEYAGVFSAESLS